MFTEFIDIHCHCFMYKGFPRNWDGQDFPTPDELIKMYNELGIEKGCILPLLSPESRYRIQSNQEVIEVCKKYPDRFIPFCVIDPRMAENSQEAGFLSMLLYYIEEHGVKALGEWTANLAFNDPLVENLLEVLNDEKFPLLFHVATKFGGTYGMYDELGLPLLENALKKFPDLPFIGHSQAFWSEIGPISEEERSKYPTGPIEKEGRVSKLLRKYQNLYADLSAGSGYNAISRDEEFTFKFFEEFQDKLCFGTDITRPNQDVKIIPFLNRLHEEKLISDSVFYKIARENAIRLLNI
jgi:uncharacterized protein